MPLWAVMLVILVSLLALPSIGLLVIAWRIARFPDDTDEAGADRP